MVLGRVLRPLPQPSSSSSSSLSPASSSSSLPADSSTSSRSVAALRLYHCHRILRRHHGQQALGRHHCRRLRLQRCARWRHLQCLRNFEWPEKKRDCVRKSMKLQIKEQNQPFPHPLRCLVPLAPLSDPPSLCPYG